MGKIRFWLPMLGLLLTTGCGTSQDSPSGPSETLYGNTYSETCEEEVLVLEYTRSEASNNALVCRVNREDAIVVEARTDDAVLVPLESMGYVECTDKEAEILYQCRN